LLRTLHAIILSSTRS